MSDMLYKEKSHLRNISAVLFSSTALLSSARVLFEIFTNRGSFEFSNERVYTLELLDNVAGAKHKYD